SSVYRLPLILTSSVAINYGSKMSTKGWPVQLSLYHWEDLDHVQRFATDWMWTYNHDRPHMALGGFTPKQRLAMAA
ncbi:integrase core domain-containing protein, partial [Burkholderia arboris]|uniref:integrase core domain-containing protein n=1 Tax=Burkholderia arboris TaxID=488730 RepID=UPI001FC817A2